MNICSESPITPFPPWIQLNFSIFNLIDKPYYVCIDICTNICNNISLIIEKYVNKNINQKKRSISS